MYNKLRLTFLGVLLLSALLLTWGMAPSAFAATSTGNPSNASSVSNVRTGTLPNGTQVNPYTNGFRVGYRQGYRDGYRDCSSRHHMGRSRRSFRAETEFDRGFADGYSKGYNTGFHSCRR